MNREELLTLIRRAIEDGVTELDLSGKNLTVLPAEIGQLTQLTKLDLSHNQLTRTSIPEAIAHLTHLSELFLASNHLASVPEAIAQLTHLTVLDLQSNHLTHVPQVITQISNLSVLNLSSNQLTTIPDAIAALTTLTVLDLSGNQLTTIPNTIAALTNLDWIDLSDNGLLRVPDAIATLPNLTRLYLNNNHLTDIPDAITELSNLTILQLSKNDLTQLPEAVLNLTQLKVLHLTSNQLTQIKAIGQLQNLEELRLRDNQLTELPSDIQQLKKLKRLDLRANPLPIPPEVLGTEYHPSGILNYYFQLQQEPKHPLNEVKMLLVGQGEVGKTSLVRRLVENSFNPHENKTHGITIQPWMVQVHQQDIQINVWDFGGQEIMHATHQFFLTKRSIYLLVLDARADERQNNLEEWIKIIYSFGDLSPIIIIGNKIDQHPLDIDQRGLQTKYPTIKAIIETSCQENIGIDALKTAIIKEIGQLEHLHDLLPQSWFNVKTNLEKLEELDRDFIPYSDYERLCEAKGVIGETSQRTLIGFLHDLGTVLNFQDDPRLEDTNVLNPQWVTNGVYKILNDNALMTHHKGVLDRQILNRILDSPRYPRQKHLFIIDIMKKFELCFSLDDADQKFLIPDLLPKEEPYTGDWQDSLAFRYRYNVLPGSVISRFIVRMNSKVLRHTYWRNGVVLAENGTKALVKADREDKFILIQVRADVPQLRREFLSAIRCQFAEVCQHLKLDIVEEIQHQGIWIDYKHLLTLAKLGESTFIPPGFKERIDIWQVLDGIESDPTQKERSDRLSHHPNTNSAIAPQLLTIEKELFISYAWGGESERFVNQLDETFAKQGITIIRDKRDLGYKGRIKAFMERIGRGKCVIVILSEKYLKSENCMFELVQIAKHDHFYERIFPIVLEDAKIYKPIDRIQYVRYWETQMQELDDAMKTVSAANLDGFRDDIDLYTEIRAYLPQLTNILKDMNTLTATIHSESDFAALITAIEQKLHE